jgi:Family of unknown function (DUF6289)
MSSSSFLTTAVLVSLTAMPFLAIATSQNAIALPANEVTTTYYSDASKTDEVGEMTLLCSGQRIIEGRRTAYASRSSSPCNSGPNPSGPTGLPCEFLAKGCSQLPETRY